MKIYTRAGDDGKTGLFGGPRVDKDDARVEAYGTVDEANAAIGLARSASPPADVDVVLERIQNELFQLGAELACAAGKESKLGVPLIGSDAIERLERDIDEQQAHLAPLKSFVLPAGTPAAAALHLARTVSRRAERRLVGGRRHESVRDSVLVYLNRLGDLLFVLARRCNQVAGVPDVPWVANSPKRSP